MQAFTTVRAVAAPMDLPNIDTDRIIPARFLRKPKSPELADVLFRDVRFDAEGSRIPALGFVQVASRINQRSKS